MEKFKAEKNTLHLRQSFSAGNEIDWYVDNSKVK